MIVKQSDIYLHATRYYKNYPAFVTNLEIFENKRGRNLKMLIFFLAFLTLKIASTEDISYKCVLLSSLHNILT